MIDPFDPYGQARARREFVDWKRGELRRSIRSWVGASVAWICGGVGLAIGTGSLLALLPTLVFVGLNLRWARGTRRELAELEGAKARLLP